VGSRRANHNVNPNRNLTFHNLINSSLTHNPTIPPTFTKIYLQDFLLLCSGQADKRQLKQYRSTFRHQRRR